MVVRFARKIKTKTFPPDKKNLVKLKDTPDRLVDELYVRNLKILKVLSKNMVQYTFFVPQIINNDLFRNTNGSHWWSPFIKNSAMPELMDRFNLLMKNVCLSNDPKCVFVNEVLTEQWLPEDFADFGHFSKSGGEKFTDILAERIVGIAEQLY